MDPPPLPQVEFVGESMNANPPEFWPEMANVKEVWNEATAGMAKVGDQCRNWTWLA